MAKMVHFKFFVLIHIKKKIHVTKMHFFHLLKPTVTPCTLTSIDLANLFESVSTY